MRRMWAAVALVMGCGKSEAPPAPVDSAALKEELKRELLAELKVEVSRAVAVATGARPAALAPADGIGAEDGQPPGVSVDDEATDVPPIAPAPDEPAMGAPPTPDDPPAFGAPSARPAPAGEPFLDSPAGGGRPPGARMVDPGEPPPIRPQPARPTEPADLAEPEARPSSRDLPPAPAPFPADGARSPVKLAQFEVSEEVDREQRVPVRPGARFKLSLGKIYAYTVVKNEGPDTQIGIEWEQAGEIKSRLYLKVGHSISGWRTWSTLRMEPDAAGKWKVRIVDAAGRPISEKAFVIAK